MGKKVKKSSPQFRSFRLARSGGITLPAAAEWHAFFHSRHGIPMLLALLIVNFSYVDMLAAPPPAESGTSNQTFVLRTRGASETWDNAYRSALPSLFKDYLAARGEFGQGLKGGSVSPEAADRWLAQIAGTRQALLAMTVSRSMKELHLGAVFIVGRDEEAARAMREQGLNSGTAALMQTANEGLAMFLRAYPWIAAPSAASR